ncbi:AMP-binding protein, partial [Candidatus Poribacteria bacterium]|nr:AMP-binding protein [Candidatus Poribacteria bacterium]
MKTIPEFFRNKVILITGATGFLGKPLVTKILTDLSDVQKMYLLIRSRTEPNGKVYSAEDRLENEFFTSSVFAKLRASHGEQFDSWIHEKVYAVEGDLADEQLGMSPACYERLQQEVQVFINAAALVKFDAPIDEAVQLNTFSAKHAVEFAKGCHDAVLIHVSTAYVCGSRTGKVAEELRPPYETYAAQHREETGEAIPDTLEAEIEEMLRLSEAVRTEANQPQHRHQFRHEALRQLGNGKRNNAELLNKQIDIVRDKWIEARLVNVGMKRAESRGWNDTYTYTKALGEHKIAQVRGDLPTAIIRPSIIESSLEEPEPGWLDGFRMADPLIVGFGKGRLPDFPGDPDIILDIIPVDFVVNAILAAAMQTYHNRGIEVYHVATGAMNPLTFGGIVEATYDYFVKYPMLDKGKPIPVPVWKYPSVEKFQRELRHKRRMLNVASWLLNLIPLKRAGQKKRRIAVMQHAIEGLQYYIQIYGPYTRLNFEFETGKTHQLYRSLSAADQRCFNFDTSRIDWNHYLQQVHIPGIKRYVLKLGDEESRKRGGEEAREQGSEGASRLTPHASHNRLSAIDNPQLEYPTIIDLVAQRAASIPNKTALQMKRGGEWVRYSYRQLYDRSRQIAFSLWNRGYRKGERFILCAENQPEWGIAYLAAVQIGIIIVPVDWQTPERELFALARFTEAKAILTTATLYKRLQNPQPSTQSDRGGRTQSSDTDGPPAFLNINCFCQPFESGQTMTVGDEGTGERGSGGAGDRVCEGASHQSPVTSHQSPIMTTVPDSFPDVEIDSDTVASIIFTAGTTVDAKGAVLSHKSFIANILAVAEALPPCETDEFLSVLPLYHAFEFTCGFLMSIYGGATVTYSNTLKPTAMLETMRETRTTVLIGMPRLFKLLYDTIERYVLQSSVAMDKPLDAPVIEKVKAALGGHIRVLVSGGAALPNDVYDRFQQLGMPIYQGYGLTETAPVLSVNPYHRSKRGSVGPAVQGVHLQIINPDSDGIGEIVARSPSLMKGYYQNPGATQKVIRDAWLYTGDLGYLDVDGYLYITGRSKDVIVSGAGKNIYPVEIEELYR